MTHMRYLILLPIALLSLGAGCDLTQQDYLQPNSQTSTESTQPQVTSTTPTLKPINATGTTSTADVTTATSSNTTTSSATPKKSPNDADIKTINVDIKNFAYSPTTINVSKGDKVVFTNKDTAPHDVTADDGEFVSARLATDQSYTLDTSTIAAGNYQFYCSIHPEMRGTLNIRQ